MKVIWKKKLLFEQMPISKPKDNAEPVFHIWKSSNLKQNKFEQDLHMLLRPGW